MRMIDAHCHLQDEAFHKDLTSVIARAKCAGVTKFIVNAETFQDFERILDLKRKFPECIEVALGLHPVRSAANESVRIADFNDEVSDFIKLHSNQIVSIGECGLDFSLPILNECSNAKANQHDVFVKHVRLASELKKPISVHSRSAGRQSLEVVDELKGTLPVKCLFHAFDGNAKYAIKYLDEGTYFSIPPSVMRDEQKAKLIRRVPLSNLLVESDAPALAPVKGERNEPANMVLALQKIAQIKGLALNHVADVIYENTLRLFTAISV